MPNISGCRFLVSVLLILILLPASVFASSVKEDVEGLIPDAVKAKVSETARPLFNPDQVKEPPPTADPFVDKIRKKHLKFAHGQQKDRVEFIQKIRKKNLSSEELQDKLAKFHQKQTQASEKFLRKEQEKMDQHNEKLKEEGKV